MISASVANRIFFQYFYFFINVGAMVGQITMTFAEKVCLLN
jgi:hypothetical protein